MRNSNIHKAFAVSFAITIGMASMAAPMAAEAKAPGTCDVVNTTACAPGSLIDRLMQMLRISVN